MPTFHLTDEQTAYCLALVLDRRRRLDSARRRRAIRTVAALAVSLAAFALGVAVDGHRFP